MEFDLVVKDGWIVDGVSPSIYKGTIGIKGDKIVSVRPGSANLSGKKVIEAGEYCVAPGFIDVHTHADHFLLMDPAMKHKLMQGVTTMIGGNCGTSAHPWNDAHLFFIPGMEEKFAWDSFGGFLEAVEKKGPALNFGSQVGLRSLYREATNKEATQKGGASERAFSLVMRGLEAAMEQGAMGMSAGPGSRHIVKDRPQDFIRLSEVVAKNKSVLSTHLYSEGPDMLDALVDTVSAAAKSRVALQISHFKTLHNFNWPKQETTLDLIDTVNSKGMNISIDCFPYNFCCTPLGVFLPAHASWYMQKDAPSAGVASMSGIRAMDSVGRRAVREHLKLHFPEPEAYAGLVLARLETPEYRDLKGLDLLTAAVVLDREPGSILIDLLAAEGPDRLVYYRCISDDNLKAALALDCAMVASDCFPTADASHFRDEVVHPRTFGTFQRYLAEYVYRLHTFTLPEAIKKNTSAPARKFGLRGRGVIGEGGFADITIFDPENIEAHATIDNPQGPPTGVEYVIVNGRLALEGGEFKEVYAGKVLRREK